MLTKHFSNWWFKTHSKEPSFLAGQNTWSIPVRRSPPPCRARWGWRGHWLPAYAAWCNSTGSCSPWRGPWSRRMCKRCSPGLPSCTPPETQLLRCARTSYRLIHGTRIGEQGIKLIIINSAAKTRVSHLPVHIIFVTVNTWCVFRRML